MQRLKFSIAIAAVTGLGLVFLYRGLSSPQAPTWMAESAPAKRADAVTSRAPLPPSSSPDSPALSRLEVACQGKVLRVVSADTGRPLDARIEVESVASAAPGEAPAAAGLGGARLDPLRTGSDGLVVVDDGGPFFVRVTAAHHVAVIARVEPGPEEHVVKLSPAARLRLVFRRADGSAVSGVKARLLVPVTGGDRIGAYWSMMSDGRRLGMRLASKAAQQRRLATADGESYPGPESAPGAMRLVDRNALLGASSSDEPGFSLRHLALLGVEGLSRESSADGVIEWDGLPAGSGYRWGLGSPVHATMQPPYEVQPLVAEGDAIRVNDHDVPDLSGAFDLRTGVTTEWEIEVARGGSVRGQVAWGVFETPVQIRVMHGSFLENAAGKRCASYEEEAFGIAGRLGRFDIRDLRPGSKVIRMWWRQGSDYWFAARAFDLQPDQDLDLGVLTATSGATLNCKLGLRDDAGQRVDLDSVFPGEDGKAIVCLSVLPETGEHALRLYEMLEIPFGEEFRLHGVPHGRCALRVTAPIEWADMTSGTRLCDAPEQQFRVPSDRECDLHMIVRRQVERRLQVQFPDGMAACDLELWIDCGPTRTPERTRWSPAGGDRAIGEVVLTLDARAQRIYAYSRADDHSVSLSGVSEIGPGKVLRMRHAASLQGRVVDQHGRPVAGQYVCWTPAELYRQPTFWVHRAETDADGRFVVRGVAAGSRLIGNLPDSELTAAPAGITGQVELVLPQR